MASFQGAVVVFGHGGSAAAATPLWRGQGRAVWGTTRDNPERVRASGASALIWPAREAAQEAALQEALAQAAVVVGSVPPLEGSDPVLAQAGSLIARAAPEVLVYLSTTGVYGDADGAWVDEDTPPAPANPRARARLAAEQGWRDLAKKSGARLRILRLSGIYGAGRSALERVEDGSAQRIVKKGQVFSRIHLDDIARALALIAAHPERGGQYAVWNLADDLPAPPQDVVTEAARLLGVAPPPEISFEVATLSPMARGFYADNKRVSNRKIKAELGWAPQYPDYRAGLAAIMQARAAGQAGA